MFLLSLLLVIGFQIQFDLFATADYVGLRINLGDLLIPVAGLGILASLLQKHSHWPQFTLPLGWVWPILLTGVMGIALLQGYWRTGEWDQWGLVNKFGGWFVLLGLFLWGAWIRTNFDDTVILRILKVFAYAASVILFFGIAGLFLRDAGVPFPGQLFEYPLAGFMVNRNAYAIFLCCFMVFVSIFHLRRTPLLHARIFAVLWLLFPLALVLIGSRASWVYAPIMTLALIPFSAKYSLKTVIAPFMMGCVLLAALAFSGAVDVSRGYQLRLFKQIPKVVTDTNIDYRDPTTQVKYRQQSDAYRIQAAKDAIEVWQANPILGGGLGSFLRFQDQKYGQFLDVIDCTPLWLLSETGLFGFLSVGAFFALILFKLAKSSGSDFSRSLNLALIGLLLTFAAFSLLHEIFYTRFVWFLLGLNLGRPLKSIVSDQASQTIRINTELSR